MRSRRARWRSYGSRSGGSARSQSSATMTIVVAQRASSMRSRLGSAGGPWEEDHAVGVTRYLVEALDHSRFAPAAWSALGNRRPHPEVELPAELLDQPLLVLWGLDVALGDERLAVARLHAEEPHDHGRLCQSTAMWPEDFPSGRTFREDARA